MEVKLGFCNLPEPIYIYVGYKIYDGKPSCWYNYNIDTDQTLPIFKEAIAGYLQDIRVTIKEFKEKENPKLELVINADETYIIRSGLETIFAKCTLLALSQISDFNKPLIIGVQPGKDKVVFCRIYNAETKQRIYSEWNPNADWYGIINKIENALGQRANIIESVEQNFINSKIKPETEPSINVEQAKKLWAIARNECKLQNDDVRSVFARFNIESTTDIPASKYEIIVNAIRNY